jgi:hypothetical protein
VNTFLVTVQLGSAHFSVPVRAWDREHARALVSAARPTARIITVRRS